MKSTPQAAQLMSAGAGMRQPDLGTHPLDHLSLLPSHALGDMDLQQAEFEALLALAKTIQ